MKLDNKLKKKLGEYNFSVYEDDSDYVGFRKFSPAGQDFGFTLKVGKCENLGELLMEAIEYKSGYDPSYEAHLWLDDTGHGKNGAPHNMVDVYNDMVACEGIIDEFIDIVMEHIVEQEKTPCGEQE